MLPEALARPDAISAYEFQVTIGIAHSEKVWSKTDVSGGGGIIFHKPVKSDTSIHREFWVHTGDGKDHQFTVDQAFGVLDGHHIAIVSFRQRGQTEWTVEMLVNLQTGETWRFDKIDDRASDAGRRLTRLARWPGYAALAILANALSIWPAGGWLDQIANLFIDMRYHTLFIPCAIAFFSLASLAGLMVISTPAIVDHHLKAIANHLAAIEDHLHDSPQQPLLIGGQAPSLQG